MLTNIKENMKKCTKCGLSKPLTEFNKNKSSKAGLHYYCKSCINQQTKQYYQDNKEKIKQDHKQYREDNKEKIKQRRKQYYQNNKEIIKEKTNKYNQENRKKLNEKKKIYYKNNREEIKKYNKERHKKNRKELNGIKDFCAICGFKDKPALVFHHRDPKNKLFTIGYRTGSNLKALIEETKKCVVLCANCHKIFHHYEKQPKETPKMLLKKYDKLDLIIK